MKNTTMITITTEPKTAMSGFLFPGPEELKAVVLQPLRERERPFIVAELHQHLVTRNLVLDESL